MNINTKQAQPHFEGVGMTSSRRRDRLIKDIKAQGIENEEVIEAMRDIPRHMFLDSASSHYAYDNMAVPIGWGQTISQPYMVALITSILLENLAKIDAKRNNVLEIGGGCGYQAAILSRFFKKVHAVERIAPLCRRGQDNIKKISLSNILFKHADGYDGWQEKAPFDAIVISAAIPAVPDNLLEQLSSLASMIMPLGSKQIQKLQVINSTDKQIRKINYNYAFFVPMLKGVV